MYEFKGIIKRIGETQTFGSGFTKREIVVEEDRQSQWKNVVAFAFKKDKCGLLDGYAVGQKVTITFAIDGREWTDPKTGAVRCFVDLSGIKIAGEHGVATPEVVVPTTGATEPDDEDIPF